MGSAMYLLCALIVNICIHIKFEVLGGRVFDLHYTYIAVIFLTYPSEIGSVKSLGNYVAILFLDAFLNATDGFLMGILW